MADMIDLECVEAWVATAKAPSTLEGLARETIPQLIAEIRALRTERIRLRAVARAARAYRDARCECRQNSQQCQMDMAGFHQERCLPAKQRRSNALAALDAALAALED